MANSVVFPLAPDLFSLQGLRNLGPTLAVRSGRPVKAYQKWMTRIPSVSHREALDGAGGNAASTETEQTGHGDGRHHAVAGAVLVQKKQRHEFNRLPDATAQVSDSKCLNQAMDSRFRGNDGQLKGNASR